METNRGCAAEPLTPETFPITYRTTPHALHTLPARPALPLTLAAHISPGQSRASRMATVGQAARPEYLSYPSGTAGQVVGRAGGGAARTFRRSGGQLSSPHRIFRVLTRFWGGWGLRRVPAGPNRGHQLCTLGF